jgi:pepF/M3 family oligoendopeptidase
MTTVFPSPASPEFREALDTVKRVAADLEEYFERHDVRRRDYPTVDAAFVTAFEEVTGRLNRVFQDLRTVGTYVSCFVTTDAADDLAQSLYSELQGTRVTLRQLETRYTAWVGSTDIEALLKAAAVARDHEFWLRKAKVLAERQMPEGEEDLAAELQPSGLTGWVRLHTDLTSLLTVPVSLPDGEKVLPMSSVRALANEADRRVRRAAYEAELKGWETVAVPLAAALNGVKGYQLVLRERRGFLDDVEPTLIANSIDRRTLAAMQEACVEAFPDFRRYMHAKARALGLERLAWYDVNAPVSEAGSRTYTWDEAQAFIAEQFGRYSERMRSFAERSFRERWIDVGPRPGKEGGAYCASIRPGESRVLLNYDGSFNGVSVLAHELGHAYHNLNLKHRTALQKATPSTLAETASIFCETLAFEAALEQATPEERLAIVECSLQRDLLVVVDIHSRFLFESAVFDRRAQRELTAREFCELMLDAQRQTYGDGLDPEALHPYMWAVKGHYYGPTFYNYPYTFGLLFGLGLYARYREDPEGFRAGYDDLLSSTGLADAAALGLRFGIDTRSPAFWRSSLDVIRRSIAEFESLV